MEEHRLPMLVETEETLTVLFDEGSDLDACQTRRIEAIVDFNEFHEPIGIEVINLKFHLGSESISHGPWASGDLQFSYGDSADVFYVRLREDKRSLDQKAVFTDAFLDPKGCMVAFRIAKSELRR